MYGGRGITMCSEWKDDFYSFLDYIGKKPTLKHSLDRIDNNGNYEPGNVKWSTPHEQQSNTRRSNKTVGVYYCNTRRKWKAILDYNNKRVLQFYSDKYADAVLARKKAEIIYLS